MAPTGQSAVHVVCTCNPSSYVFSSYYCSIHHSKHSSHIITYRTQRVLKWNKTFEREIIMAFDGLFTAAIAQELQQIKNGRISKIHQPNAQEVVLLVRAGRSNYKLLVSTHPSYSRVQLTDEAIANPA